MKFCAVHFALAWPQNLCHTDRHFPKIDKSCSGLPKTYKAIKKRKSKIFAIPILSAYVHKEESKNSEIEFRTCQNL
ncbi:unnamed protein product [Larinioides sclopetarius]|uniref:Secreted protein n=1 Tax=Larinioides sclopetarius TaxID=280406 RepID=A0AAV2BXR8_9ARAC